MVSRVFTVAPIGFGGSIVEVECDTTNSLPSIQIVGLGNKAIDEAKERVRSAITNSFLEFPKKKITVNLAPAQLPKDGTHYDLPIALSILCVSNQIKQDELENSLFVGELALDGHLRGIKGAVNIAQLAKESHYKNIFLPEENVDQAGLITGINIFGVKCLKDLFLHLKKEVQITAYKPALKVAKRPAATTTPLLDDIKGQEQAKRALIIAAAGHHNILLNGPPGAGKTMLAKAMINLLPPLTNDETIETTKIHSFSSGKAFNDVVTKRPFRSPHHTSSIVAMVGGGNPPKPGEISLAHTGVLFLDELPEYSRSTLESLRQPLEDKKIDISRANSHVTYPANFMMVATMNPCPCGHYGDPHKECSCTSSQILAYQKRLSGPLLDRIDLIINVSRVPNHSLMNNNVLSNSQHQSAQELINRAINIQNNRYDSRVYYNSSLSNRAMEKYAKLSKESSDLLLKAADKLSLSARGYFKIIKVARTIADIEGVNDILPRHISEALQYRDTTS